MHRRLVLLIVPLLAGLFSVPPALGQPAGERRGRPMLERLERMSPEERRRVLAKLPPERRKRIERQLERYEGLSPQDRQRLRRQYRRFDSLPRERQQAARRLFQEFRRLPEERQRQVRLATVRLRHMSEEQRRLGMDSPQFRRRFTPPERRIIRGLVELMP